MGEICGKILPVFRTKFERNLQRFSTRGTNIASKEGEGCENFEMCCEISKCVAKISKCVAKILKCVVNSKCVSKIENVLCII